MKYQLIFTILILQIMCSTVQAQSAIGNWEYEPTKTVKLIEATKNGIKTKIDNQDSYRYYDQVSDTKYKCSEIENLFLEVISGSTLITYNTSTNKKNTWKRLDVTNIKMENSLVDASHSEFENNKVNKDDNGKSKNNKNSKISNDSDTKSRKESNKKDNPAKLKIASSESRSFLNFGVGFLSNFGGSGGIPPVSLSYNRTFKKNIKLGGYAGFATSNFGNVDGYDWNYRYLIFGARGTYHFDLLGDKFDPYAGLMLGYTLVSFGGDCEPFCGDGTSNYIFWSGLAGLRYQLTDRFEPFAELGYGISYFTIGMSINL